MPVKSPLYDSDFFAWSRQQAELLRAGKLAQADIEHIAEEIDSMGRAEKRELISRLSVLLLHLLKWRYQPERQSPSWEASIRVQRNRIGDHLDDNPSLKPLLPLALASAYRDAALEAVAETGWRVRRRRVWSSALAPPPPVTSLFHRIMSLFRPINSLFGAKKFAVISTIVACRILYNRLKRLIIYPTELGRKRTLPSPNSE